VGFPKAFGIGSTDSPGNVGYNCPHFVSVGQLTDIQIINT